MSPCQSRWSWSRVQLSTAARWARRSRHTVQLETRTLQHPDLGQAVRIHAFGQVSSNVGRCCRHHGHALPALQQMVRQRVTVVLPLVPVTPVPWAYGLFRRRPNACANRLNSPPTHRPMAACRGLTTTQFRHRRPGRDSEHGRMALPCQQIRPNAARTNRTFGHSLIAQRR